MTPGQSEGFHPAFVLAFLGIVLSVILWHRLSFRRGLQVFSLTLFVVLFWLSGFSGRPSWPVDLFLFTDPLVALIHTIASRVLMPILLVSLVFVALAALMGRVFCSHVCPMGTVLDVGDFWLAKPASKRTNREAFRKANKIKLGLLFLMIGAALGGFNLLGLFDPLVWFTRIAATVFYPFVMVVQELGLQIVRPIGSAFGVWELAYLELILPAFEGSLLFLALFMTILLLGRLQKRFWCRHLCPLGGLLGLAGRGASFRRRVDEKCNGCNVCVRSCPMGAIHEKGLATDRSECIVCLHCVGICPEKAINFRFTKKEAKVDAVGVDLTRRLFMGGLAGGLSASVVNSGDMLHTTESFLPLPIRHGRLIRPPGSLPETAFLGRCIRCGQCMRACLTNTLQPDWYRSGLEGLWAPHMNLRHAACEQTCNGCGYVCPTGAIRNLSMVEKQHAKVGTAVILRDHCLPWSQDRRCLICDEQCPYNAIVFVHDTGHRVPLPIVNADRCNGCGQCEDKCPLLGEAAIVVGPQGELRLNEGSYVEEAKSLGLVFEAKGGVKDQFLPPVDTEKPDLGQPAHPPNLREDVPEYDNALPPGIILEK